jgi:mono/diheme cytochrome c family protein
MIKKLIGISFIVLIGVLATSCDNVRREPGHVYMPDMMYSRAYDTYAQLDSTKFTTDSSQLGEGKIFYTTKPVTGTMARGDDLPFPLPMDKFGDTVNYAASKKIPNPLPPLTDDQMKEAERLFLVNCAICHGMKLDGNGPLYNSGNGPFISKPADFAAPQYLAMPDGQMFYSVTYGKNAMGSYASQLTSKQRWMIVHYIKAKQAAAKPASAKTASPDSTLNKK